MSSIITHPIDGEELLPTSEAAKVLGCTEASIGRWASIGKLPRCRIVGRYYYRRSDLLAMFEESRPKPIPAVGKIDAATLKGLRAQGHDV